MKFYKYKTFGNYLNIIFNYKLNAIYCYSSGSVAFFENGKQHNAKNATYIFYDGYKEFYLDGKLYGDKRNFTKLSWRRFVKLQVFL
jgi:hypothetical protein